eukprot:EG_transcript_23290
MKSKCRRLGEACHVTCTQNTVLISTSLPVRQTRQGGNTAESEQEGPERRQVGHVSHHSRAMGYAARGGVAMRALSRRTRSWVLASTLTRYRLVAASKSNTFPHLPLYWAASASPVIMTQVWLASTRVAGFAATMVPRAVCTSYRCVSASKPTTTPRSS